MGTSTSKFKKYLQHGDEYAAMQVYQGSPELQRGLNPNHSYGDQHYHNTPLHYAALHGMKHLIRAFLNELGGNPNQRNGRGQTSLHCVCSVTQQKSLSALERRLYSVVFLLSWRGPCLPNGQRERMDVNAKDDNGFTALHYASQSGLMKCVEYLLAHGADPLTENKSGLTPCDMARLKGHHDIATFLESKMVPGETPGTELANLSDERRSSSFDRVETYSGLKSQDLLEAKEQLVNETADLLHVQYFTAETLLKHFEWSRENLLDQWNKDPFMACKDAGVQPPTVAYPQQSIAIATPNELISTKASLSPHQTRNQPKMLYSENSFVVDEQLAEDELLCDICCDLIEIHATIKDNGLSCRHNFCTRCWKTYLYKSLPEHSTSPITCPLFDCNIILPMKVIEEYVSPKMIQKYIRFGTESSLDTENFSKLCPYPDCQRVSRISEAEKELFSKTSIMPPISHGVDCGAGHFFCWDCGSPEAHAPISCSNWQQWLTRCEELTTSDSKSGQGLSWLITNTRQCPNCNFCAQKFDGCTNVKCIKCHYDFCWVCLGSWKTHSAAQDGYFQCNRYESIHPSIKPMNDSQRTVHKFLHYFVRYKNHSNSRTMEKLLLKSGKKKHDILRSSMTSEVSDRKWANTLEKNGTDLAEKNSTFFEDGILELVNSRSCLCASYAYGFYLSEYNPEKDNITRGRLSIFETLQNELEDLTEHLSEALSRPQLRTPRRTIISVIQFCKNKRLNFSKALKSKRKEKCIKMNPK